MDMHREDAAVSPAVEYEAVFRAAPDGFVIVDGEGVIQDLNPAAERMFDYPRDELIGHPIEVLVPERSRDVHRGERAAYSHHPHPRPMGIGMELTGRRKDGSEFPVEISLSPMVAGGSRQVIAAVRDVSERKRLRAFGAGALRAAEEERQRIARELHDDTAQRLAALLVRLELATRASSPAERHAMVGEIREGIEDAADSVRRIARNLRPPVLDELGVVGAIRTHARALEDAYGVAFEIDEPVQAPRFTPDTELALYRVVQEALSNVVRHSETKAARVGFALDDGALEVVVSDTGRGFDTGAVERQARGLGLVGMRERARHAGAELAIESAAGAGTRVRVRVPLEPQRG